MTLVDVAGWAGGLLVLVGYVLVSAQRMRSDSRAYQAMNVAGGLLLTCSAIQAEALPNLAINLVWIVAGSLTLTTRLRHDRRAAQSAAHRPERADVPEVADTLELPVVDLRQTGAAAA